MGDGKGGSGIAYIRKADYFHLRQTFTVTKLFFFNDALYVYPIVGCADTLNQQRS